MNEESQRALKAKWVEALRSGDYKQGTNRLRIGDEYCCLGVLCDVYRKITPGTNWIVSGKDNDNFHPNSYFFHIYMDRDNSHLLPEIMDAVGMKRSYQFHLSEANDDMDMDFDEIADIIECGELQNFSEDRDSVLK